MINSGSLFGTIDIYMPSIVYDEFGGSSAVYSLISSTRANVNPMTGKTALQNGQKEAIKAINFSIRYRTNIVLSDSLIIVYKGLPYSIYSIVDTSNKRKEFQILAKARENLKSIPLTNGTIVEFDNQFNNQFI